MAESKKHNVGGGGGEESGSFGGPATPSGKRQRMDPANRAKLQIASFDAVYPKGVRLSPSTYELFSRAHRQGIAFDEVTLADQPVDFHPNDVNLTSFVTRNIRVNGCGILSAAMDSVTEKELALALAKAGGLGILHRNLSPTEQAAQLRWVRTKIYFGGMVEKPVTFGPTALSSDFERALKENGWHFSSFPIVDDQNVLLGMVTRDRLEFNEGDNPALGEIMIPLRDIPTAPEGTTTEGAYAIMKEKRIKKLPVVSSTGRLVGIYMWNDVRSDHQNRQNFSLDIDGHFLVGAAIGPYPEEITRAELLVKNGCKVLVIDGAHGSCQPVKEMLTLLRSKFGQNVELIAGNVSSYHAAMDLLHHPDKPDAIKVGIGSGSVGTTREGTGCGVPQMTAVFQVHSAVRDYGERTGFYVPVISDGGIRTSGDIVKCLSAGANAVMIGGLFAGTHESPATVVQRSDGRSYKRIRGMRSRAAVDVRKEYREESKPQGEKDKKSDFAAALSGVEGFVLLNGSVDALMNTLLGGVKAGLAHSGAQDVASFQSRANLWKQSFAGVLEGKPHDISEIRN